MKVFNCLYSLGIVDVDVKIEQELPSIIPAINFSSSGVNLDFLEFSILLFAPINFSDKALSCLAKITSTRRFNCSCVNPHSITGSILEIFSSENFTL